MGEAEELKNLKQKLEAKNMVVLLKAVSKTIQSC